jgi:hypothetical protein
MDLNGVPGRADVVDVRRVGEEVHRRLAVKENKVGVRICASVGFTPFVPTKGDAVFAWFGQK